MLKIDEKKRVLTGDRPTGRLHLGHLAGSLKNRVSLQDNHDTFVMVADVQALTDNVDNPEKVRDNVLEVLIDNLAVGVDANKATFFIQSEIPQIAELTVFFLNLVSVARLGRNPTVKSEMKQKGYADNVTAGFLMYPVSQAADILCIKSNLIPVGEDQMPMIEQTNEIVRKFNSLYGDTFGEVEGLLSDAPRMKGIDGKAKMSKSLNNAIYLSDETDAVREKVMSMYTDPSHLRVEDPGRVEGNVVFDYLNVFDLDVDGLSTLKNKYTVGGVGDVEIKNRLIDVLEFLLAPIRARRREIERDKEQIMGLLKNGGEKVRQIAAETLHRAKVGMKINY